MNLLLIALTVFQAIIPVFMRKRVAQKKICSPKSESAVRSPQSAVRSPHSTVRSPQSAVRSPQSAVHSPCFKLLLYERAISLGQRVGVFSCFLAIIRHVTSKLSLERNISVVLFEVGGELSVEKSNYYC